LLQRYPTLRRWYQLFDPGHGHRDGDWFTQELNRVAPTGEHPQFFVTWYDAWAFCKFAYWNEQSCRLPHEDEWEQAAKAQVNDNVWHWRYWWGDDVRDEEKAERHCTFNRHYRTGTSTRPIDADPERNRDAEMDHRNPIGLVDILGNQWEWCEDRYREVYSRTGPTQSTSRVLRGGAWYDSISNVRCSVRYNYRPTNLDNDTGFRVSRALEIF
jgi:formylglycine-generating enzyme required for sulfatase activity